jgi:hypothetical protein
MKTNKIIYLIVITVLSILLAACGAGQVETEATLLPETITAEIATPTAMVGACANPYLPTIVGATWNYKMTGTYPDTFTRSIVAIEANSFTDQDIFSSGVTRQGKWNCDNGNLIALDPIGGNSASITTAKMSANFQTTELSGITLPGIINAGDKWSQSIKLEGIQEVSGMEIPAHTQTNATCTASGIESVTVEAGNFDAMHFDCQITIDISITLNGNENQTTIQVNSNNWHAANIGMIKTIATGAGINSTIELVSYNIP